MLLPSLLALAALTAAADGVHLGRASDNKVSEFLGKSELDDQELAKNHEKPGTRWAVLIAGSDGWWNYRHQADVCHAYQLLKKGGLKDENIVVFMYDDIAGDEENPEPGKIFNSPDGPDVYEGVPKDYTGADVSAHNFYAAILGNRSAITGGSGKVVDSGPNDHIFIYYSDHGGGGVVGMPEGSNVYADDLNKVLKEKHALGTYKQLVFYMEACESGAMFQGLLPKGLNIYAITAANADESSWAYYCPDILDNNSISSHKYTSCLGDLFSISWMEDVEAHDRKTETLQEDYEIVKNETGHPKITTWGPGSHVLRFGDVDLSTDHLYLFMGEYDGAKKSERSTKLAASSKPVRQHDADLVHFQHKVRRAPEGSKQRIEAQHELDEILEHRNHIDHTMAQIGAELFGWESVNKLKSERRDTDRPVVDDWDCLKSSVRIFETHCGSLSQYGLKHMRYLANMCNAGVSADQMSKVSARVCPSIPNNRWSSLGKGLSA